MSTVQTAAAVKPLTDSQTCRSLCGAFLGEMNDHRLYMMCARRMEEASLDVVAHAFRFTAAQEKEHADIFRGFLAVYGASSVPLPEDAPLLSSREPLELLHAAAQSEHDAGNDVYPRSAQIALEEGYPRIAHAFRRIAETERLHALRFRQYAKALAEGSLFRESAKTSWLCLSCGQFHTGQEAPPRCSNCGRDQGHFIRSSFYPFSVFSQTLIPHGEDESDKKGSPP